MLSILLTCIPLLYINFELTNGEQIQNCSKGWKQFDNKCFMFYADKSYLSFYEAHIVCKDFYNATLVSIHSDEEQLFLTKLAFSINKATNHVWIGARRISNDTFIWEDNSPFNYTNWAKTQPNNLEGKHYCASLLQSTNLAELGNWYDDPCADKYNFICQTYIQQKPSIIPFIPNIDLSQKNITTSRITLNQLQKTYNKPLRANSTTISALIASSLNTESKDQQKSSSANIVLIIVTVVQFLLIVSLIFIILRKNSMFPPYRTLVMSECSRNAS